MLFYSLKKFCFAQEYITFFYIFLIYYITNIFHNITVFTVFLSNKLSFDEYKYKSTKTLN